MLRTEIHVHFDASAPHKPRGIWAWVETFVGSEAQAAKLREELGAHRVNVFRVLVETLHATGFDDVIHVFLGQTPLYTDPAGKDSDLGVAVRRTLTDARVAEADDDLRLVCSQRHEGLHFLLDVVLRWDEAVDLERVQLRLSARIEELQVRKGETAAGFAGRIRAVFAQTSTLERYLDVFDAVSTDMAAELDERLPSATVTTKPGIVELIRGGPRQIGRLRNLGFGNSVRPPTYRAVATHQRRGAYDRPFFYYYFDPYHDLMCWIGLEALQDSHAWASPRVVVLAPNGDLLMRGDDPDAAAAGTYAVRDGAVSFDDHERLVVSKEVPMESSVDPVEVGSPYGVGYGGDAGGG